jgi:hypothetical protein
VRYTVRSAAILLPLLPLQCFRHYTTTTMIAATAVAATAAAAVAHLCAQVTQSEEFTDVRICITICANIRL